MSLDVGSLRVSIAGDMRDADQGFADIIGQLRLLQRESKQAAPAVEAVGEEMTGAAEAAQEMTEEVKQTTSGLEELQQEAKAAAEAVEEVGTSARTTAAELPAVAIAVADVFTREVVATATEAGRAIEATGTAIDEVGRKSLTARQGVASVAQAMTAVSGGASSAAGQLGSFATSMVSSFAVGGPIALGIGAVAGGISLLSGHLRDAAQDARQLEALHDVLGVSSQEVDRLRSRLASLGQDVDQRVAVQIMRAGREAGYSAGEITRMADELKKLSDLSGGDIRGATAQMFRADNDSAKDLVATLQRLTRERRDQAEGVRKDEREVIDATRERQQELERLRERHDELTRSIREASEEYHVLNNSQRRYMSDEQKSMSPQEIVDRTQALRESIREMREEMAAGAETSARLSSELDGISEAGGEAEDALQRLLRVEDGRRQAERAASDAARRLEEERRLTEQRLEASERLATQTRILQAQAASDRKAELRELAEEEIRIQQQSVDRRMLSEEAFAAWVEQRRAQLARELATIDEEAARESHRREQTVSLMRAQAMDDRATEARIMAQREMEEEQAKVDGIRYTWEEYYQWRTAREMQLQADLRRISEQEAERAKRERDKLQSETDRMMRDQERHAVAGIQAGGNFIAGMRQAFESGEAEDAFRSLLQLASSIMSMVPGGQIPGAIMGAFSGLFHDGGMVGTGGAPVPRFHSGGMIVAHQGVMLPEPGPGEVPILAQTGEGVLSRKGVAAAGGPDVVRALNAGEQPAGGGGGGVALTINAGGGFLTRELLRRELMPLLQQMATMQADPVMQALRGPLGRIERR